MLAAAILLIALAPSQSSPKRPEAGIVYSDKTSFSIVAPKDWVLDSATAQQLNLPVVLYPKDSSWVKAETAMYANVATKSKIQKDLAAVIRFDVTRGKLHGDKPILEEKDIKTKDNRQAVVYRFDRASVSHKGVERVAYIDLPNSVAMLVMTSKSRAGSDRSNSAFESLIHSFSYLGATDYTNTKTPKSKGH
jgi:hypothetical protein